MKFSSDLLAFLGQLHQDFFLLNNPIEGVTDILVGLGRSRSFALASHLDALLSQPYELVDLEHQWTAAGVEFYLGKPEQIPLFLAMVRDLARSERVMSSAIS